MICFFVFYSALVFPFVLFLVFFFSLASIPNFSLCALRIASSSSSSSSSSVLSFSYCSYPALAIEHLMKVPTNLPYSLHKLPDLLFEAVKRDNYGIAEVLVTKFRVTATVWIVCCVLILVFIYL
jgi:hypothetical protein